MSHFSISEEPRLNIPFGARTAFVAYDGSSQSQRRRYEMREWESKSDNLGINDLLDDSLTPAQLTAVVGGLWKRNGVIPGYRAPEVIYDDGINVLTTDPSTSNVAYDSPFTPIPHPA
jgi:hypothetical protein